MNDCNQSNEMRVVAFVVLFAVWKTIDSFLIQRDASHANTKRKHSMILLRSASSPKIIPDAENNDDKDTVPNKQVSDIALVSITDNDDFVAPVPLGHVPEALRTCSIYQAPNSMTALQKCSVSHGPLCGFLYNETFGCIAAMTEDDERILYRGECLFRIVEIETTIPYTVATVELIESPKTDTEVQELVRLKDLLLDWAQLDLEKAQTPVSPLEESLLENNDVSQANIFMAQERLSVIDAAPLEYLVDLVPDIMGCNNAQRCKLMTEDNVCARVQFAREIVQEGLGMERARKLADSITDTVDDTVKDLKVGTPTIPAWAQQIRKDTRLEYFWNVEVGWCSGTVTDDPVLIVDEWLISVRFDDDGSVHRLPLSADDKVRWRPLL